MHVSVVIPSYNHAAFIEEAIASVLATPGDDLELVVVDDGSSDDTLQRLERLRGDSRLCIHAQANQGAPAALNRGLELARGELVFILNSDDLFAAERIPRLAEPLATDPSIAIAATWIRVIDDAGVELGVKRAWRSLPPWPPPCGGPHLQDLGDPSLAMLQTNYVSTTSNIAFRRELVTSHGLRFQPLRYTHDWDFILQATAHGRIELVEEPLVSYRVHGANTIREGRDETVGTGLMRFEIMWSVVRHATAVCRRAVSQGHSAEDLRARLWRSLPRFGCDSILAQLLALRGSDPVPPAAYDDLLRPAHPFREAAIATLARSA